MGRSRRVRPFAIEIEGWTVLALDAAKFEYEYRRAEYEYDKLGVWKDSTDGTNGPILRLLRFGASHQISEKCDRFIDRVGLN